LSAAEEKVEVVLMVQVLELEDFVLLHHNQ
jgi:hypothetical protein